MSQKTKVILGNSNPRFSGVTSTMLQTMAYQRQLCDLNVLGKHNLPDPSIAISFREAIKTGKKAKTPVVFHARRNDEMIQALILKKVLGANLRILFTSTAQRHHSRLTRWLMSQMDAVISTCQAAANFLQIAPATIIPHGVDTRTYMPATDKVAAWQATGFPGKYGIGIFGRVRKQKGTELFVDACLKNLPDFPDTSAVIVGAIDDPELVERCKRKAVDAGLQDRILFTGELPFEQIPVLFRAMSLVCALSYNEGYGLTVLEALASGTAVLATKAGAWPDILANRPVGRLVNVGDQEAITKQMHQLLTDPNSLATMGSAGRKLVEQEYKIEDEARSLIRFYEKLARL